MKSSTPGPPVRTVLHHHGGGVRKKVARSMHAQAGGKTLSRDSLKVPERGKEKGPPWQANLLDGAIRVVSLGKKPVVPNSINSRGRKNKRTRRG